MSYEALWQALEAEHADGAGHVVRRIHPEAAVDLFLAVAKPSNRRMMTLSVGGGASVDVDELPAGRGIETRAHQLPDQGTTQLELILMDPSCGDIFGSLVQDIAEAVAPAESEGAAVSAWVARLRRWQRLLAHLSPEGLSGERQRGLYGELWLLRHELIPAIGEDASVRGWTGPDAASHDFELSHGAIEVKATAGKQHQVLRIASERQLDDTGVAALFLLHVSLDVRQGEGETLVDAVAATRSQLAGSAVAALYEEKLLTTGYSAAHESRYRRTAYTLRERNFFHIDEDFPRITEADLPPGVGDVRYSVAVSEAKHWVVSADQVAERIREEAP